MDVVEEQSVNGDLHLTEIPQQFMLPKKKNCVSGGVTQKARSKLHDAMRNQQYEKKLANNAAVRLVSRYRVPVDRPLPVNSLEVSQTRHKKDFKVQSFLAPLFGRSGTGAAELSFLIPAKNNPRRMIEEKKKSEERPRSSNDIKQRINEPKHMPNLDKKVSKNFIPRCATASTHSSASYIEKRNIVSKPANKPDPHLKNGKKEQGEKKKKAK